MSTSLRIAIAQLNPTVGDIAGNVDKILAARAEAARARAQIVVCPELVVAGYPPEDLVLRPAFIDAATGATRRLAATTGDGGPALIFGNLHADGEKVYNAAFVCHDGRVITAQPKTDLPNYGVFDEKRIFSPGPTPEICTVSGRRLGLLICEDMWSAPCARMLKARDAELLIVINASPFEAGKLAERQEMAKRAVAATGLPLLYVNTVGGQDELVFDGGSFALAADGTLRVQAEEFTESLTVTEWTKEKNGRFGPLRQDPLRAMEREETLYHAMVIGLRDYVRKNGFSKVLLGLSGGIDSALVAAIAADAMGSKNVLGVILPSPYSARESAEDAQATAKLLNMPAITVPITPAMEHFETLLASPFSQLGLSGTGWMEDVAVGGNLQARLRANLLMAISNRTGAMLLNTGNKSELAVGYTTMYGDMCGGYAVLKDAYKTTVAALARWRNGSWVRGGMGPIGQAIPQRSIDKPPTAELAPGQKDEDQLPPYKLLDAILERLIERRLGVEIIDGGYDADTVRKIERMLRMAEYKRRQSPPGPKLTSMHFGRERRFPITNRFAG